ncbi:MAG TPA: hypothetical protein EYG98_01900 [Sulfurovum sp.]|nr:hypothetical protein [Sulfurovum sp.]
MLAMEQEQLFDNIDILPIDMKTTLVTRLLKSINPTDKSIDALWIEEVNKRKKQIESEVVKTIDGDTVFKKIHQRLNA